MSHNEHFEPTESEQISEQKYSLPKFNDPRSETAFWLVIHHDRAQPYVQRITKVISENLELFGAHIGGDSLKFAAEFLERYVIDQKNVRPNANIRKTKRGLFMTV